MKYDERIKIIDQYWWVSMLMAMASMTVKDPLCSTSSLADDDLVTEQEENSTMSSLHTGTCGPSAYTVERPASVGTELEPHGSN